MKFNQQDIVIVNFPYSDFTNFKKRPALVLSNELINKTTDYLLMQITTRYHDDKLTIEIEDSFLTTKLPFRSYLRIQKIFCLNESMILSKISTMNIDPYDNMVKVLFSNLKRRKK